MQLARLEKMIKILGLSSLLFLSACTDGDFPLADLLPESNNPNVGSGDDDEDDEDTSGGGGGSGGTPTTPPPAAPTKDTDILKAYEDNLHTVFVAECGACHSTQTEPLVTAENTRAALVSLSNYQSAGLADALDMKDVNNSFVYTEIAAGGHFGMEEAAADAIKAGIENMINAADARFSETTGPKVKEDIAAFRDNLHTAFLVATCGAAGCHGDGGTPPEVGAADVNTAYFEFTSHKMGEAGEYLVNFSNLAAIPVAAYMTAGHPTTNQATADGLTAAIGAWATAVGVEAPAGKANYGED